MINYNLNTSAQSLGGGINEIEDRIDIINFTDIPWFTIGTYSCPEGTYKRIYDDIIHDRIIRIAGLYNILIIRDGTTTTTPTQVDLYYYAGEQSQGYQARFSSDDTVEISPYGKIILNKNNWAGNTLQFTEEGIYNLLNMAIARSLPVYVTASVEYAIIQYLDKTNVSAGNGISGRYIIESGRILKTIDMFVTTEDEVYLTIINTEQLTNPI